jgi:hypothetical protein
MEGRRNMMEKSGESPFSRGGTPGLNADTGCHKKAIYEQGLEVIRIRTATMG